MKTKIIVSLFCVALAGQYFFIPDVFAVGINTNVALPVPKNHFVLRTQTRYTLVSKDPTGGAKRLHLIQLPLIFVYGITAKAALFGAFPVAYRDFNAGDPAQTAGVGDVTLLGRYELFHRDWHLRTFRVALLGGLEIPSGDSPFTSDSLDVPWGGVTSFQSYRQEIDLDLRYKVNTKGGGVTHGDDFIYNFAYQLRLLPWRLPESGVPKQLNFVIEANGQRTGRNEISGATVANTGGHQLFLSPGLQLAMKRIILEASVQIPIVQGLNGTQLKTTLAANSGMRVIF